MSNDQEVSEVHDYQRDAIRRLKNGKKVLVICNRIGLGMSEDAFLRIKEAMREAQAEIIAIDSEAEVPDFRLPPAPQTMAFQITQRTMDFGREMAGHLAPPKNKPWYHKFDKKRRF